MQSWLCFSTVAFSDIDADIYCISLSDKDPMENVLRTSLIWIGVSLITALLIMFLMNRKYFADLRENEEYSELKTIQDKLQKTDHEAGSGVVGTSGMPMKAFTRYDIIVDNTAYRVSVEQFLLYKKGDKIVFYYAAKSRMLLGFEVTPANI